jgi:hypothetical protein
MLSPAKTLQIQAILNCLNSAQQADAGALHCLMAMRVPTNEALLDHPDIIVRKEEVAPYFSLGPMGVINGILTAAGLPRISIQFFASPTEKSADGKNPLVRFVGFSLVPEEHQPDDIRKEMEEKELAAAVAPLPTADQKLWEIIGVLMSPDANVNNQYGSIIYEIEKYFGVGDPKPLSKGDAAIKALQELVDTKNMKDSGGKTPEYEARRLAAWEQAEKILSTKEES